MRSQSGSNPSNNVEIFHCGKRKFNTNLFNSYLSVDHKTELIHQYSMFTTIAKNSIMTLDNDFQGRAQFVPGPAATWSGTSSVNKHL